MKPQRRGDVHRDIAMVHPVEAPQKWHFVGQHMLGPDRKIQQQKANDHGDQPA